MTATTLSGHTTWFYRSSNISLFWALAPLAPQTRRSSTDYLVGRGFLLQAPDVGMEGLETTYLKSSPLSTLSRRHRDTLVGRLKWKGTFNTPLTFALPLQPNYLQAGA